MKQTITPVALTAFLIVVVMFSCGAIAHVDSVRVLRESASPANSFEPFDLTLSAESSAIRVHELVQGLPEVDSAVRCDEDSGLRYRLSFRQGGRVLEEVVLEGAGCLRAYLAGGVVRQTTALFWTDLALEMGLAGTAKSLTLLAPSR
jgi:hypothetical protein